MTSFGTFKTVLERKAFLILATLFVVGLAATCVVLPWSYVHWIDDVMINEFGRFPIGAHQFEWNMNWYPFAVQNSQTSVPFYLGGALLEIGYRLFGEIGPRCLVFSIFVLSVLLLFLYLKRKTSNKVLAALMALMYFSYPAIQVSVRGARVDMVAMAFVIAALLTLQFKPRTFCGRAVLFGVIGALCAIGGFVWISVTLVAPVVLWEMLEYFQVNRIALKERMLLLVAAGVGAVIAALVILIPFYPVLDRVLEVLRLNMEMGTGHAKGGFMVKEFLESFLSYPGFFAIGLVLLCFKRRLWVMALGSWLLIFLCIRTNFYINRMIYFLPAAIIGMAVFYQECRTTVARKVVVGLLVLMAALSYGRTCVLRNLIDWHSKPCRDYAGLTRYMEREIGRDVRIYNSSFTLYYVGRDLGWRQFRATGMSEIPPEKLRGEFDCYICDEKAVTPDLDRQMREMGFNSSKVLNEHVRYPSSWLGRLLYRTGRMVPILGAYRVYKR